MSTAVIIALIVAAVVIVAVAVLLAARARGARGGGSLRQRFGPEYDRAVARHDGDTKAAERDLQALVERHGDLRERPLEPTERATFSSRWTAAQERFVDSPREAVTEADRLIAEAAGARGFPDGGRYEEQVDALTVHHAAHVDGYRQVHRVARERAGEASGTQSGAATEDMRAAMVEARALFEELIGAEHEGGRHRAVRGAGTGSEAGSRPMSFGFHRHQPKHG